MKLFGDKSCKLYRVGYPWWFGELSPPPVHIKTIDVQWKNVELLKGYMLQLVIDI